MSGRIAQIDVVLALFLAAVSLRVSAQGLPASFDPYAVADEINASKDYDIGALWQQLGLSSSLETYYIGAHAESAGFDRCGTNCVAEVSLANLDGIGDDELVLKIYQSWGNTRFLVFRSSDADSGSPGWELLGHADHDFARLYMPSYRIEARGGARFFVVTAQGTSGTGVALKYEQWYALDPTGLAEVLTIPVMGYYWPGPREDFLQRKFDSSVSETVEPNALIVNFHVAYSGEDMQTNWSGDLFERDQPAVFLRDPASGRFLLDAGRSQITFEEIETVYEAARSLSCEEFLRYNSDYLIANAPDLSDDARAELGLYLSDCPETGGRRRLLLQQAGDGYYLDADTLYIHRMALAEVWSMHEDLPDLKSLVLQGIVRPRCIYCKIDVEFGFRKDPANQCRAIFGGDDPVVSVSKPYLERPRLD